jgi:hypothetical protein
MVPLTRSDTRFQRQRDNFTEGDRMIRCPSYCENPRLLVVG